MTGKNEQQPVERGDVVLELKHVSKHFGDVHAVEDATLEVRRGEVLTLLGPSGCGKTTTLRMVVGLERVTHGEIVYGGRIVDSDSSREYVPTHKRNMGMVFQSYAIWPHMTVAENVAYPLRVRHLKRAEIRDRVSNVLDQVGLSGYEHRPATMLSGGQQQRVAVARSLVFEPDLLLMDEPFSNLDAKLRDEMRTELRLLQRRLGITVLFVTHDQIEALSISDRIVVMNKGHIEQVGTPIELYREPKTAAVRDFLGKTVVLAGVVEEATPTSVSVRLHDGDGPVVQARTMHTEDLSRGDKCLVAVRPEDIEVKPKESAGAANSITAVIRTLLFIGDRFEARVALPWGDEIFLYLPPDDRWGEGQELSLSLSSSGLHVWPASAAPIGAAEGPAGAGEV